MTTQNQPEYENQKQTEGQKEHFRETQRASYGIQPKVTNVIDETDKLDKPEKTVEGQNGLKDSYLHELYHNARNGGKKGTQLEWWTEENWVDAVRRLLAEKDKEKEEIIAEIEKLTAPGVVEGIDNFKYDHDKANETYYLDGYNMCNHVIGKKIEALITKLKQKG